MKESESEVRFRNFQETRTFKHSMIQWMVGSPKLWTVQRLNREEVKGVRGGDINMCRDADTQSKSRFSPPSIKRKLNMNQDNHLLSDVDMDP